MKYALFLGCTIPARSRNYEMSARAVAHRLGIELVDIFDFSCCGFPLKSSDMKQAGLLAARNLALAEAQGLPICTLCSACTSMLAEEAHLLARDRALLEEVNRKLGKVGLSYSGHVKVKHFARVLMEDVGLDRIREAVTVDLKGLPVATHYGCHYLKPSEIYEGVEDPENPSSLEALVTAVGARSVEYAHKRDCCGGAVLVADEETALKMAKGKLDHVKNAGAKAMNVVCPFCSVMYDDNQKSIENQFETSYGIPVLFLSQILGLAMGFDRKELGLNMNVVKTKGLTEEITGEK
jgi:heterodisulfide reductase subunit B2